VSESYEHCIECEERTGRAGAGEDSLFHGYSGPFCENCFDAWPDNQVAEIMLLKARVAEIVTALQDAVGIIQADANTKQNYGSLCRMGNVLAKDSSGAWMMRQKADAVDASATEAENNAILTVSLASKAYRLALNRVRDYASRLRQAADKAGDGV
jgi:hypothetical protein